MTNYKFYWLFPEETNLEVSAFLGIKAKEEGLEEKLKEAKNVLERFKTQINFGKQYSEITENKDELIKQLLIYKDKNPEKIEEVASRIVKNYNRNLDEALKEFPKTIDAYWQVYRRNGAKMTLPHGLPEEDSEMSTFVREFFTNKEVCENPLDLEIAPRYNIDFNVTPSYEVSKTEETILGLKKYMFKINSSQILETFHDLRENSVPKLASPYTK